MDFALLVALGSLVVAAALAFFSIRKSIVDRRLAKAANREKEFKAPAEKDSIIISGAKETVLIMRGMMEATAEENTKLRNRLEEQGRLIADQEARIRFLEKELARLHYEGSPNE